MRRVSHPLNLHIFPGPGQPDPPGPALAATGGRRLVSPVERGDRGRRLGWCRQVWGGPADAFASLSAVPLHTARPGRGRNPIVLGPLILTGLTSGPAMCTAAIEKSTIANLDDIERRSFCSSRPPVLGPARQIATVEIHESQRRFHRPKARQSPESESAVRVPGRIPRDSDHRDSS